MISSIQATDVEEHDSVAIVAVFSCGIYEACRIALDWFMTHPELAAQMAVALMWSLFAGLSTGSTKIAVSMGFTFPKGVGGLFVLCFPRETSNSGLCL